MANKEKILCIKKNLLPMEWIGQKVTLKLEKNTFFDICSKAGYQWIDRDIAETDTSLKQIIPYVILQTENKKETAVYKRHGTEKRLHDLWSCGIGGHINPKDKQSSSASFKEIVSSGMERELDEELIQRPKDKIPSFAGIINEEITEVGIVHMGIIFRITTNTPAHFIPGKELKNFQWVPTKDLNILNMELWSHLALELIS